jgi:hypothetical protein
VGKLRRKQSAYSIANRTAQHLQNFLHTLTCLGFRYECQQVPGWMIVFIDANFVQSLLITISTALSLIYTCSISLFAFALGFSVSTSCILAADLNTGIITSNHHEVFLSFLLQSPWAADSPELDPVLQFNLYSAVLPFPWFLTLYS